MWDWLWCQSANACGQKPHSSNESHSFISCWCPLWHSGKASHNLSDTWNISPQMCPTEVATTPFQQLENQVIESVVDMPLSKPLGTQTGRSDPHLVWQCPAPFKGKRKKFHIQFNRNCNFHYLEATCKCSAWLCAPPIPWQQLSLAKKIAPFISGAWSLWLHHCPLPQRLT